MRVDLPAPLSPTSAITSPSLTSKSASRRAWTEPKFFETPRSSSVGGEAAFTGGFYHGGGAPGSASTGKVFLLAELLVLADADLAPLQEAFGEEKLVVRLRDPDRLQQDRLRAADLAVDARNGLLLDDRDRSSRCRVCLFPDGLVDGARLPAGEDELDAGRRRILPRQRELAEPVGLQRGDYGTGQPVVRGEHAVDLVGVLGQHLIEDRAGLGRAPVRVLVARLSLLERAVLVEGVEDRVIPLLEQDRVVVLDVAVQLGDHW